MLLSFLQIPQSEFLMRHVFASLRSYINKVHNVSEKSVFSLRLRQLFLKRMNLGIRHKRRKIIVGQVEDILGILEIKSYTNLKSCVTVPGSLVHVLPDQMVPNSLRLTGPAAWSITYVFLSFFFPYVI